MADEYERQSRSDRAEAERPESGPSGSARFMALRGPVGIRHGRQVANDVRDQKAVMAMLDKLSTSHGGNRVANTGGFEVTWPAPVQGKCHALLFTMILRVQNHFYTTGGKPPGQLGFVPDGVVDPGGRTEGLMQAYSGQEPPYPSGVDFKELAKQAIPTAATWVAGALKYLTSYQSWRRNARRGTFNDEAARVHLHLDSLSDTESLTRINEWIENYRSIDAALREADRVFVKANRAEALQARLSMHCWGVAIPAWAIAHKNIWFGPGMMGLGIKCRAAILLHESGHYIRTKIGHQGGERGAAYDRQSADQALTSAYVCANFATHAATGRDERFGLTRPKE